MNSQNILKTLKYHLLLISLIIIFLSFLNVIASNLDAVNLEMINNDSINSVDDNNTIKITNNNTNSNNNSNYSYDYSNLSINNFTEIKSEVNSYKQAISKMNAVEKELQKVFLLLKNKLEKGNLFNINKIEYAKIYVNIKRFEGFLIGIPRQKLLTKLGLSKEKINKINISLNKYQVLCLYSSRSISSNRQLYQFFIL